MGVRRTNCTEEELGWMRLAIQCGRTSVAEDEKPRPRVGAVLVRGGEVLERSSRGETGLGDHAEFGILKKLGDDADLSGSTVFTTLEPCSRGRSMDKVPCAQRLIERGVGTVFIGMYDPDPRIHRDGWRLLRDAGVVLRDFEASLRDEVIADNPAFVDMFRVATGMEGTGLRFDYKHNGGYFDICPDIERTVTFKTRWTSMGADGVYAYDSENHVAHARYVSSFEEIDDPGASDFSNYTVPVRVGEVVVFRNDAGFALVKLERVDVGTGVGYGQTEVEISYQLRLR